jgi:hypothetical protein
MFFDHADHLNRHIEEKADTSLDFLGPRHNLSAGGLTRGNLTIG